MSADHAEKACELFAGGLNCSQSVFAAFSDVTGMDCNLALRLSSSFGGGMGRMREVCGTCSAMFMIAGILYGKVRPCIKFVRTAAEILDRYIAENPPSQK